MVSSILVLSSICGCILLISNTIMSVRLKIDIDPSLGQALRQLFSLYSIFGLLLFLLPLLIFVIQYMFVVTLSPLIGFVYMILVTLAPFFLYIYIFFNIYPVFKKISYTEQIQRFLRTGQLLVGFSLAASPPLLYGSLVSLVTGLFPALDEHVVEIITLCSELAGLALFFGYFAYRNNRQEHASDDGEHFN
jgi:hypothetical protein